MKPYYCTYKLIVTKAYQLCINIITIIWMPSLHKVELHSTDAVATCLFQVKVLGTGWAPTTSNTNPTLGCFYADIQATKLLGIDFCGSCAPSRDYINPVKEYPTIIRMVLFGGTSCCLIQSCPITFSNIPSRWLRWLQEYSMVLIEVINSFTLNVLMASKSIWNLSWMGEFGMMSHSLDLLLLGAKNGIVALIQ